MRKIKKNEVNCPFLITFVPTLGEVCSYASPVWHLFLYRAYETEEKEGNRHTIHYCEYKYLVGIVVVGDCRIGSAYSRSLI